MEICDAERERGEMKNGISIHGDVKHDTSSPPARAGEGEVKWSPRSEQFSREGIDKSRIRFLSPKILAV